MDGQARVEKTLKPAPIVPEAADRASASSECAKARGSAGE
jgi:hypothetical protein